MIKIEVVETENCALVKRSLIYNRNTTKNKKDQVQNRVGGNLYHL